MAKKYISAELQVVRLTTNVIATSFEVDGVDNIFNYGGETGGKEADAAGRRFYDWDAGY